MSITTSNLSEIFSATYEARNKWSNLLLQLGMGNDNIEAIRLRFQANPDDCLRTGLYEWLEGGERNWKDLVMALSSPCVSLINVANNIERKYLEQGSKIDAHGVDKGGQTITESLVIFTKERLGTGAFAVVFKGLYDGRPCAVKVMHNVATELQTNIPAGEGMEKIVKAFERECEFLKSFQHANVVKHISTEKHPEGGNTILITELMDCNLRSYFSSLGDEPLGIECEVSICKDVASGLAYIHSRDVIHRDLCGDNILLKLGQSVPLAKITDFGMSRLLDPAQHGATLSAVGHRIGYLPPEAVRQEQYDKSLDVFSLGVIMVQVVCRLETIQTAKDREAYAALIPTTNHLKGLIDRCLKEDMKQRPTARSIGTALERISNPQLVPDLASTVDAELESDEVTTLVSEKPLIQCEKISLECIAEYSSYPLGEQTCWAVASLKAPSYESTTRAPVEIVAVVDKSGSMSGEKIKLVKDTLSFMIDQLKETDRLSVVTFDSNVNVNFGLVQMNETNKEEAKSSIASIQDGSSTNLCGGLLKGMEILSTQGKAQVQSVLLMTDGLPNIGLIETGSIVTEVQTYRRSTYQLRLSRLSTIMEHQASFARSDSGYVPSPMVSSESPPVLPPETLMSEQICSNLPPQATIYTFGFGSNHDSTLLETISTQGGGVYYYIESSDQIPRAFADCLGGVLSVMGQNLSLTLELQGRTIFDQIHSNKPMNWHTPKSCEIALGDLQSEEERVLVMELRLPPVPRPQQDLVVRASLSYFNVITAITDVCTSSLGVSRQAGNQGTKNETVDKHRNRVFTADALRRAESLADKGMLEEAQDKLLSAANMIGKSHTADTSLSRFLAADLRICSEKMEDYDSSGKSYMRSRTQAHCVQRTNSLNCSPYDVSQKSQFRSQSLHI